MKETKENMDYHGEKDMTRIKHTMPMIKDSER